MRRTRLLVFLAFTVPAMMLPSCASSVRQPQRATSSVASIPVDSPLTGCVDPTPAKPEPIDTNLARDFAGGRVQQAVVLDGGAFRADPAPRNAAPRISAALAFCNLLAGATIQNYTVIEAAREHGMSFGLGVLTVADTVLKTTPQSYLVGGRPRTATLQSYHRQLAWIAVTKPDLQTSCPGNAPAPAPAQKILPGYQILAIDADTGAAGIVYATKTNAACGFPGYQPSSVAPAVERVSVPWTLIKRGPGTQSAAITYQPRPCDSRDLNLFGFGPTAQPAAFADRDNPARVNIVLHRILTSCGPAATVPVLLRSSDLKTDLPQHLIHAPVGAEDIAQPS
jgi:hypothetical protein